MRILLTGATGFVGNALAERLALLEHDLVFLSRHPEHSQTQMQIPGEWYAWDPARESPPSDALRNVDAVIHLAGESVFSGRWTEKIKEKIELSRILGTRNLIEGFNSLKQWPKVFICASAIGYYGDRAEEELSEESSLGSGFLADVCEKWEAESRKIVAHSRVVNVRIGLVLGSGGGAMSRLGPLFKSSLGGTVGGGKQWMSWIHLEDLISVFVWALENKVRGPINAVSPDPVTNTEFTQKLAKNLNRPAVCPVPKIVLKAALGEAATLVLASTRVQPKALLSQGFVFRYPQIEKAFAQLAPAIIGLTEKVFIAKQWIPHKVEDVFLFFSRAENLEKITLPELSFKVVAQSTAEMGEGTILDYRLKLHGIPLHFKSLITQWKLNDKFVDLQLEGPYAKWHHTHQFVALKNGTLLKDRVVYALPIPPFGDLFAGRKVARDVERIFEYRKKMISELFGFKLPKSS